MKRKSLVLGGVLAGLAIVWIATTAAKPAPDTPRYDPDREYTLKGTVVETRTHSSTVGYEDMHLMLDTGHGVFEVHLAPVAFLTERGVLPAKGDEIQITGSKVIWQGADVVVAREIVRTGRVVAVRSADGAQLWSRRLRA